MMTMRCTRKLLDRLPLPNDLDERRQSISGDRRTARELAASVLPTSVLPTTSLGDWYATILFTRPAHLILAVNDKSRLCLLLPAREMSSLEPRFQTEAVELLRRIGASAEEVEHEVREMSPLVFASTKIPSETGMLVNRSVLGSMNDFTRMVQVSLQLRDWDLRDLSAQMCETPCGPLGMRSPRKVACGLLREDLQDAVSI